MFSQINNNLWRLKLGLTANIKYVSMRTVFTEQRLSSAIGLIKKLFTILLGNFK